ncbi:hypothetical protein [Kribbella sp. NPDC004875]|uniref:hypothetical protein n=1 Tax=Kribbella sp. NPDC004875 TaxID=3364107 RepID=UPI0036C2426D
MPLLQQALAAAHDGDMPGHPVGIHGCEANFQCSEPTGLRVPFLAGPVSARPTLAARLCDRLGEPVPDHPNTGGERLGIALLRTSGEAPLSVRRLRDRSRPPRRRRCGQVAFPIGPSGAVVVEPVLNPARQISRGKSSQVLTHSANHQLVAVGQPFDPVADADPGRRGDGKWALDGSGHAPDRSGRHRHS